jgi:hypothetical protein
MVLMDRANFKLFDSDVTGVHRALGETFHRTGPMLKGHEALVPLRIAAPCLPVTEAGACTLCGLPAHSAEWLWPVAGAVLAGRRVMLVGMEAPFGFLKWLLWILPRSVRERVDVSVNISFSPVRHLSLMFVPEVALPVVRLARSQSITLWRAGEGCPSVEAAFAPWIGLLQTLWGQGRFADLIGLVAQVPGRFCADSLNSLAGRFQSLDSSEAPPAPPAG